MSDIEEVQSVTSSKVEDEKEDEYESGDEGKDEENSINEEDDQNDEDDEEEEQDDDDISDIEDDNISLKLNSSTKKEKKIEKKNKDKKQLEMMISQELNDNEDDDSDVSDDDEYYKKFEHNINKDHIIEHHPQIKEINYDEISVLTRVVRDKDGNIIDPLHKTIPVVTRFERAKVIGQRAKQINNGAQPFIKVPDNIIDGNVIAEMEFREKKIPFIIVRPIPNGKKEYWKLRDLEIVSY